MTEQEIRGFIERSGPKMRSFDDQIAALKQLGETVRDSQIMLGDFPMLVRGNWEVLFVDGTYDLWWRNPKPNKYGEHPPQLVKGNLTFDQMVIWMPERNAPLNSIRSRYK
jgi:hypothetical protein